MIYEQLGNSCIAVCYQTILSFNRRQSTRKQDTQTRFLLLWVTLTFTRWPWYAIWSFSPQIISALTPTRSRETPGHLPSAEQSVNRWSLSVTTQAWHSEAANYDRPRRTPHYTQTPVIKKTPVTFFVIGMHTCHGCVRGLNPALRLLKFNKCYVILKMYAYLLTKTKFLGESFQKLEHYRQTDRHIDRCNGKHYHTSLAGGKKSRGYASPRPRQIHLCRYL